MPGVVTLGTLPTGVVTVGVVRLGTETFTGGVEEASTGALIAGGPGIVGVVGGVTSIGGDGGVTGAGPTGARLTGVGPDAPDPERFGCPEAMIAGAAGAGTPLAVLLRGGAIEARGLSRAPRRRTGMRPLFASPAPA